jgi:hypothetical protein
MRERARIRHPYQRPDGRLCDPGDYYVRRWPAAADPKGFAKEVCAVDADLADHPHPCLPTLAETDIDHGPAGTEVTFMAVSANTRP